MQLMIILDATVVTVALPTIQGDLGFSQAGLAWVMNSYLIAFAGLLLLAGRIGDLIGSKRVFVAGLGLFTAASLLCGLAGSSEVLIGGRFLQGVGGALASAVILGMIVNLYPGPGEQARAMGVYSFTSASGASIGLIFGGVITQTVGWHWAFLINVPIGLTALAFALRFLAQEKGLGLGKGADVLGAVLVTAGLSLGVYTIVQTAEPHATLLRTLILAAVSILLLAAFVLRQARIANPLLSLHIFRKRQLTVANVIVVLLFAAGFGFQFTTALYVQRVLGYDSLTTGLAFLPAPIMNAVMSLSIAPRLTVRFGPRTMLKSRPGRLPRGAALDQPGTSGRFVRRQRRSRTRGDGRGDRTGHPGRDHAGHVRCGRQGRRTRLRPEQHRTAGRCGRRDRRTGDTGRFHDDEPAG